MLNQCLLEVLNFILLFGEQIIVPDKLGRFNRAYFIGSWMTIGTVNENRLNVVHVFNGLLHSLAQRRHLLFFFLSQINCLTG